jgi:hypothetical protein
VAADPIDGCTPLRNSAANSVAGAMVLIRRGNCYYGEKGINVRQLGGLGVIIVYNDSLPGEQTKNGPMPILRGQSTYALSMPFSFVSKASGRERRIRRRWS